VRAARSAWRGRLLVLAWFASAGSALADEAAFDREARAKARGASEVRRVWVLSDPASYGYGNRQREIVVYDVVCEEGKMTRVSEGFETASGPKFGEGWVLRTQAALSAAAAQEQLQHALADLCGI
jgi:hypothetical protein